ncbi:MAG: hypothetical protein IPK85_03255 [Gemmatimonadetes bacterium]|nr:hypothetical protein [Gemmatimonadota bacterium]
MSGRTVVAGIDTTRAVARARAHYEALAATAEPAEWEGIARKGRNLVACLSCGTLGMRSGSGVDENWRRAVAYWDRADG